MNTTSWQTQMQTELERAEAARRAGNEGMARVCARRAAGAVVGEYLARRGIAASGPSAYDRLRYLNQLPGLPEPVYEVVGHFLTRITPEHTLPVDADLLADVTWLAQALLDE
jgi:hypothetical protein